MTVHPESETDGPNAPAHSDDELQNLKAWCESAWASKTISDSQWDCLRLMTRLSEAEQRVEAAETANKVAAMRMREAEQRAARYEELLRQVYGPLAPRMPNHFIERIGEALQPANPEIETDDVLGGGGEEVRYDPKTGEVDPRWLRHRRAVGGHRGW